MYFPWGTGGGYILYGIYWLGCHFQSIFNMMLRPTMIREVILPGLGSGLVRFSGKKNWKPTLLFVYNYNTPRIYL